MRRLLEDLIQSLPLSECSRRVLDETLLDWKHEDDEAASRVQRWICDVRSTLSVLRAVTLLFWQPSSSARLAQPLQFAKAAQSPRDEILGLIIGLSAESSYDDILKELTSA